jgi:DNA-directed RNA polymerase I subunit RPA12
MSVIGSLLFCTDCGNLLDESTGNDKAVLICGICGTRNKGELTGILARLADLSC